MHGLLPVTVRSVRFQVEVLYLEAFTAVQSGFPSSVFTDHLVLRVHLA